jgi:hypothetical protein
MRKCTICTHSNVSEINHLLIQSTPYRDIAGQYGTSKSALERHRAGCIPAHLLRAKETAEVLDAGNLMARLSSLEQETHEILRESRRASKPVKCPDCGSAVRVKDNDTALKAISRIEAQLKLFAELRGMLVKRLDARVSFRDAIDNATPEEVKGYLAEMQARRAAAIAAGNYLPTVLSLT